MNYGSLSVGSQCQGEKKKGVTFLFASSRLPGWRWRSCTCGSYTASGAEREQLAQGSTVVWCIGRGWSGALGVAGLVHWVWLVWCIGRGWSGALGVAGLVHWVWLVWCIGRGWSGALGVAGLVHWAWLVWCIGRGWSGALGVAGLVHWAWLVWCIGRGWSGALGVAGLVLTCQSCSVRGSLCGGQTSSLCGFVHQITHPAEGWRGGVGWGGGGIRKCLFC